MSKTKDDLLREAYNLAQELHNDMHSAAYSRRLTRNDHKNIDRFCHVAQRLSNVLYNATQASEAAEKGE